MPLHEVQNWVRVYVTTRDYSRRDMSQHRDALSTFTGTDKPEPAWNAIAPRSKLDLIKSIP